MPKPVLTCVLYHHIRDDPGPFLKHLNITTSPDVLQDHIEYYLKNYDVVDVDTIISGELPPRPLLITFDDSFRSTLEIAAPIMKKYGVPGVAFLNPEMITGKAFCLDNLMSYLVSKHGPDALAAILSENGAERLTVGDCLANHVARGTLQDRRNLKRRILDRLGCAEADLWEESALYLRPSDVKEFATFGLEVGNHSASHVHCRTLKNGELSEEIGRSRQTLDSLSGAEVRTFAFPYGNSKDSTPAALGEIRQSGHAMIFLVHARSNKKRPADDIWYRVSLTNESTSILYPKLRILPKIRSVLRGTH
ncbi:MAG: polysaccharide deacetylase family protein [Hyphomicrobiales bacterium]|nr:polysaccharide deacetylase family protein [Hyphomicrobiales bacterium]